MNGNSITSDGAGRSSFNIAANQTQAQWPGVHQHAWLEQLEQAWLQQWTPVPPSPQTSTGSQPDFLSPSEDPIGPTPTGHQAPCLDLNECSPVLTAAQSSSAPCLASSTWLAAAYVAEVKTPTSPTPSSAQSQAACQDNLLPLSSTPVAQTTASADTASLASENHRPHQMRSEFATGHDNLPIDALTPWLLRWRELPDQRLSASLRVPSLSAEQAVHIANQLAHQVLRQDFSGIELYVNGTQASTTAAPSSPQTTKRIPWQQV